MASLIGVGPDDPPPGKTSVRFSAAFLQPELERHHYGLYRRVVTVKNEEGSITRTESDHAVGPFVVFRRARRGDRVDLRTSDPKTGAPMKLTEVWRAEGEADL